MKGLIKILWNLLLWLTIVLASVNYQTTIYIFYQAKGQLSMLLNTTSFEEYKKSHILNAEENYNLELIDILKKYSEDSLGLSLQKISVKFMIREILLHFGRLLLLKNIK